MDKLTKGLLFEKEIINLLSNLPSKEYRTHNTIIVPNSVGETSQIDIVVVSKYCIFVLEVKCMQGELIGRDKDKMWSQRLGSHLVDFYNPVIQNNNHIMAIKTFLNMYSESFRSIIVFPDECNISGVESKALLVNKKDLIGVIKAFNKRTISDRYVSKANKYLRYAKATEKDLNYHKRYVNKVRKSKGTI